MGVDIADTGVFGFVKVVVGIGVEVIHSENNGSKLTRCFHNQTFYAVDPRETRARWDPR